MGMLTKSAIAGGGALLASEDAEAGWVANTLGKPVLEGWHGGLKGIDRFRDEYLGSGEGAHVYTHGHYVADSKKTASKYYNDRKREYARDVANDIFDEDLMLEYTSRGGSGIPLEFKVGNAPSIFILPRDYQEIVEDAVAKYGKNTQGAQDHISRKLLRYDQRQYDETLDLIQEARLGEWEVAEPHWQAYAHNNLRTMLGMSDGELNRSITYDIMDQLPPEVSINELSRTARTKMKTEILLDRLEMNATRYRQDMVARQTETISGLSPAEVAASSEPSKLKTFEFKIHPDFAEKYAGAQLVDWSKVAEESTRKPGMYKLNVNVQEDELLHWEKPLAEHPEAMKIGIQSAMRDLLDNDVANGFYHPDDLMHRVSVYDEDGVAMTAIDLIERLADGNFPPGYTAADFATHFSSSVSYDGLMNGEELSKLLRSKGVKGMMYRDGWTRHKDNVEPTYNYVIYGDDLMSIMERGASTAPMNMLLAMGTGAALGAPVLNKEIAERFPMPEPPERGYWDRVTSMDTYANALSPYMPLVESAAENVAEGVAPTEYPARLLSSVVEGIANLTAGESPREAGSQFVERLKTPYDQTMDEASQYVLDKTGSPGLATGAYMGMFTADPSNWIGP